MDENSKKNSVKNQDIEGDLQQEAQLEEEPESLEEFLNDDTEDSLEELLVQPNFTEEDTETRRQLRGRLTLKKPAKFDEYVLSVAAEISEPKKLLDYKEAVTCTDRENWIKAMQREMEALKENRTWVMTKLP